MPKSGFTRRDLLRAGAGPAVAGMLGGCRTAATARSRAPAAGKFIDLHTHIAPHGYGPEPGLNVTELLHWMDRHDVARAVVMTAVQPESFYFPISTDYVLTETRPHRDRLIPFCGIDPRNLDLKRGRTGTIKQGMVNLLRQYVDAGASGMGEYKPGLAIDDPRNMTVFEACAEVGLPVLFHMDDKRNMDSPGLPGLRKVLSAFPQIPFIAHAQGWWASIDGAVTVDDMAHYPKRGVAPGGAIDALMDEFPNIHGDLSAFSGANAITRDPDFGRKFLIRRADRLLFGTDYLSVADTVPHFELYASIDLPADVRHKIYRGNVEKLLKLDS